jgi:hypothetical protein
MFCGFRQGGASVQDVAERVQHAARDGAVEVRDAIRAQPIAAILVLFAVGYLLGRLGP